jgi:hypothetical protein
MVATRRFVFDSSLERIYRIGLKKLLTGETGSVDFISWDWFRSLNEHVGRF